MKNKKILVWLIIIVLVLAVILCAFFSFKKKEDKLVSVKSEKELMKIYEGESNYNNDVFLRILTFPIYGLGSIIGGSPKLIDYSGGVMDAEITPTDSLSDQNTVKGNTTKEHSTTNIQVENVDEADITKTDGDFIYSISEDKVIITNVEDATNPKIETRIESTEDDYIPVDLLLYGDKLVVIAEKYINYNKSNTLVNVYDISSKSMPKLKETYTLHEKYYTSRCINGKLFVISSGKLRKENNKIDIYYNENNKEKKIELSNIQYLTKVKSKDNTIISSLDLNKDEGVKVNSYLFNVKNAYISEKNMYLLNEKYEEDESEDLGFLIKKIFGLKGIIGFFSEINNYDYDYNYDKYTQIYKFNINDNGTIKFNNETKVKGTTINQFSLDEYNDNLRIGLYTRKGSRVVVFDKSLNQLGETDYLSEGEKMYSTRFVGNKAYMVTYKNTDPLYVIDLSNPKEPTVLGKLKIPGYSTYLQPYDDTHIIGIGMQTEEKTNRNSMGKVISKRAVITGMKMALFDVSDVNNPIQISQTLIGDSRTTSAILTNHKALLFSAEKGIIAIPVNNYNEDFEVSSSTSDISTMVNSYVNESGNYISEGYFVYDINLKDGFKLKGVITHENNNTVKNYNSYYMKNTSKLLRGMWIEDKLYTISENMLKVNRLDNLEEIAKLNIKEEK